MFISLGGAAGLLLIWWKTLAINRLFSRFKTHMRRCGQPKTTDIDWTVCHAARLLSRMCRFNASASRPVRNYVTVPHENTFNTRRTFALHGRWKHAAETYILNNFRTCVCLQSPDLHDAESGSTSVRQNKTEICGDGLFLSTLCFSKTLLMWSHWIRSG